MIQHGHQNVLVLLVVGSVRIPIAPCLDPLQVVSRHKTAACFHQPPGNEHTLAEHVPAVGVFELFRLPGKIEGLPHRLRQNHFQGLLSKLIQIGVLGALNCLTVTPIDQLEKSIASLDPFKRERLGQAQFGNLVVLPVRVRDLQRIVLGSQKVGPEIVASAGADLRNHDVGRNVVALSQLLGNDGAECRKLHRRAGSVSRHGVVMGHPVVVFLGVHRADDRQLVHLFGHIRQQLRDLNSRCVGGNGFEGAVGFGIPSVDVARSAVQPQKNTGFGPFTRSPTLHRAQCRFEFQDATEGDPQETQGPRPQDRSTADRAAKAQSLQLVHESLLIGIHPG